jgi:hypothetical protein
MSSIARWWLCGGCCAVLALSAGCTAAPSFRDKGVREATEAIAAGKLKLKEYPALPSPAQHGEYIKLLKERCDVDYEVPMLPPGVADADFRAQIAGWNETMEAEIKRKFGAGILAELRQEADKRWQEKMNAGK